MTRAISRRLARFEAARHGAREPGPFVRIATALGLPIAAPDEGIAFRTILRAISDGRAEKLAARLEDAQ